MKKDAAALPVMMGKDHADIASFRQAGFIHAGPRKHVIPQRDQRPGLFNQRMCFLPARPVRDLQRLASNLFDPSRRPKRAVTDAPDHRLIDSRFQIGLEKICDLIHLYAFNLWGFHMRICTLGVGMIMTLTMTGCGTVARNADVGVVHVAGRAEIADPAGVEIVESAPTPGAEAQAVSGYSCRNKMWDPPPSRENAIALMKKDAKSKGFDAIHSVKVTEDPAAIAKNCWQGLIATGMAFRLTP